MLRTGQSGKRLLVPSRGRALFFSAACIPILWNPPSFLSKFQATGMALVRCILGKFLGVACHCFPPLFLDVPTFHHQVPPRPPRRERSQRRKWELWARMLSGNFAEMTTSTPLLMYLHKKAKFMIGCTFLILVDMVYLINPKVLGFDYW